MDMKSRSDYQSNGQLIAHLKQLVGKYTSLWMGKSFQPMPSYWALIPVKVEKNTGKMRR